MKQKDISLAGAKAGEVLTLPLHSLGGPQSWVCMGDSLGCCRATGTLTLRTALIQVAPSSFLRLKAQMSSCPLEKVGQVPSPGLEPQFH